MYIDPGTDIYLFSGVPLDNTYDNTIYFTTPTEQIEFFINNPVYNAQRFTNQTYQRLERGYMRLKVPVDSITGVNYCAFRNTRYSSKWWYAFVLGVEFINNEVAELHIEIDVIQTWLFHTVLDSCFVERQHASTDVAGDNLLPESFELGEYVSDGVERFTHQLSDLVIVVASPYHVAVGDDAHWGEMYSNMFSGIKYRVYPATVNGAHTAGLYINEKFGDDPSELVSVFMCPRIIAENASCPAATDEDILFPAYGEGIYKYSSTGSSDIYGFTFHNQKLLTYPYCALYVSNNTGGAAVYPYEYFANPTCTFLVYGSMSTNPSAMIVPTLYKGAQYNWDESLQIQGWPQCSYATDTFKAYTAQIASGAVGNLVGSLSFPSSVLADAPPKYDRRGNVIEDAGASTLGMSLATGVLRTVGSIVGAKISSHFKPSQAHGAQGSSPCLAAGVMDYTLMHKRIQPQYARIIDGFWDSYGYPQRLTMVPNRIARRYFTYIKTVGCHVRGAITADANRRICDIYDHGIRWWKPDSRYIGDVADMAPDNVPMGT